MTISFSTYLYHAFDDRLLPTVPFGMAVIAIISDEYILWHRTHTNISNQNCSQFLKNGCKCLPNARQSGQLTCGLTSFRCPFHLPRLSTYK